MLSPPDPGKDGEIVRSPIPLVVSRVLALDVGDRRIGLALSDPLGYTAQPLMTVNRKDLRGDLKSLARVIRKHSVSVVVVGLPLHASGAESPQSTKTRRFAEALQNQHPGLSLHLIDERHTTQDAHGLLDTTRQHSKNESVRRMRRAIVDQVSAVLLLDAFLSISSPRLLPQPEV